MNNRLVCFLGIVSCLFVLILFWSANTSSDDNTPVPTTARQQQPDTSAQQQQQQQQQQRRKQEEARRGKKLQSDDGNDGGDQNQPSGGKSKRDDDLLASSSSSSSSSATTPTLSWDVESKWFDKSQAAVDVLKFTNEALEHISSSTTAHDEHPDVAAAYTNKPVTSMSEEEKKIRASLTARGCSTNRFLFVNTHTWGRHHNQLQEILHTIAFARRLKRTAILGFFRAQHRWWNPAEFYDLSLLLDTECVVTFSDFRQLWSSVSSSALCMGQGTKATPLAKIVRCSMVPNVPSHYATKTGFMTTRDVFFKKMMLEKPEIVKAHFLGLSGEIAFFLRPGILTTAKLLSRIRPAKPVLEELGSFLSVNHLTPNRNAADFWKLFPSLPSSVVGRHSNNNHHYFSLHLRQRERDCLKEVGEALELNPSMQNKLSAEQQKVIRVQCAIPVSHVNEQIFDRHGISRNIKTFLASDHENMVLERALVERGAVMYKGKFVHNSLLGLAVDFFALAAAANFSGNQLSSISQNVCFMRLGLGLSCHGFVVDYSMHLSAPIGLV